jgi:hypothetical protein
MPFDPSLIMLAGAAYLLVTRALRLIAVLRRLMLAVIVALLALLLASRI